MQCIQRPVTLLWILILFISGGCNAQQDKLYTPTQRTVEALIGETRITLRISTYGIDSSITYFHLHDDEQTALAQTSQHLARHGGQLIKIENGGKRIIRFRLSGKIYAFDPNRIFSTAGISATLTRFSEFSSDAITQVSRFAEKILQLIPGSSRWIVAVHNNTDGGFSIKSYLPTGEYARDAADVFVNPQTDPDNFFLTTDSLLYHRLSLKKFSTVLQDNKLVSQDGSLSVYCGENQRPYLNCEAQHLDSAAFRRMVDTARREIDQLIRVQH